MKDRVYFVIDMKSFFASVECAERGLDPMKADLIVADEDRTQGTVCLAVSPHLKTLGVKNRCRLFEVPKGLDYTLAKPRMKKYIEYASKIYGIYLKYIDKNDIHVYSIDECFIDATDYLKLYKLRAKDFAIKLTKEIYDTLKIPSSVGIGTNMYLAKIALDITAKHSPDRIGWLTEEKFRHTLWKHTPLSDFWQISTGTIERLKKYNISTMEGIAYANPDILYKEFGINAELMIDHAWGKETCLIKDVKNYKSQSKSISSSQILPCNYRYKDAKIVMKEMIQNGCYDLARQRYNTSLIHIFVGYGDSFKLKNHAGTMVTHREGSKGTKRMRESTNLYYIIGKYADELFDEIVDKRRPIRKIGYDFADLVPEGEQQYDFFTDYNKIEKEKSLVHSILDIQDKYGKNAILKALDLSQNATQMERNKMVGGHNG